MERLTLENVRVIFRNFSGASGQFNAEGNRVFSVVIEDLDYAKTLISEGWALKELKNEDGVVDAYQLPVKLNYGSGMPPRVYKVSLTGRNQVLLNEETIGMLDYLPIDYVDVVLNPYRWTVRGETGIKAYCQSMYVVIEESALDVKWANFMSTPFDPD